MVDDKANGFGQGFDLIRDRTGRQRYGARDGDHLDRVTIMIRGDGVEVARGSFQRVGRVRDRIRHPCDLGFEAIGDVVHLASARVHRRRLDPFALRPFGDCVLVGAPCCVERGLSPRRGRGELSRQLIAFTPSRRLRHDRRLEPLGHVHEDDALQDDRQRMDRHPGKAAAARKGPRTGS